MRSSPIKKAFHPTRDERHDSTSVVPPTFRSPPREGRRVALMRPLTGSRRVPYWLGTGWRGVSHSRDPPARQETGLLRAGTLAAAGVASLDALRRGHVSRKRHSQCLLLCPAVQLFQSIARWQGHKRISLDLLEHSIPAAKCKELLPGKEGGLRLEEAAAIAFALNIVCLLIDEFLCNENVD
jgi:hypothetical protein